MQTWAVIIFCIGLTILSLWYTIVEILFWNQYPKILKESIERNNRYRLDRIIHYVIWWLITNIITIFTLIGLWQWKYIINQFNQFWKLATEIVPRDPMTIINIQLILFSIFWFIIIYILPLMLFIINKLTNPLFHNPIPMLSLTRFTQHVAHTFSTLDRAILKIALITFGILIVNIFPVLTTYHRWYYLGLIFICEAYLVRKIWSKKKK